MNYVEMTTEEAIEVLKQSKGKKVLVAIQDLDKDENMDVLFVPNSKSDCEIIIREAQTIAGMCDDFVRKLDLFIEKQWDLSNTHGILKTILING